MVAKPEPIPILIMHVINGACVILAAGQSAEDGEIDRLLCAMVRLGEALDRLWGPGLSWRDPLMRGECWYCAGTHPARRARECSRCGRPVCPKHAEHFRYPVRCGHCDPIGR